MDGVVHLLVPLLRMEVWLRRREDPEQGCAVSVGIAGIICWGCLRVFSFFSRLFCGVTTLGLFPLRISDYFFDQRRIFQLWSQSNQRPRSVLEETTVATLSGGRWPITVTWPPYPFLAAHGRKSAEPFRIRKGQEATPAISENKLRLLAWPPPQPYLDMGWPDIALLWATYVDGRKLPRAEEWTLTLGRISSFVPLFRRTISLLCVSNTDVNIARKSSIGGFLFFF